MERAISTAESETEVNSDVTADGAFKGSARFGLRPVTRDTLKIFNNNLMIVIIL